MLSEIFEAHVALQLKLKTKLTWYLLSLKPCTYLLLFFRTRPLQQRINKNVYLDCFYRVQAWGGHRGGDNIVVGFTTTCMIQSVSITINVSSNRANGSPVSSQ